MYMCCDSVESIPQSDPTTVSDFCLDGGLQLVLRVTSPFCILILTTLHLALFLILVNYITAIASASVPLSEWYSSESLEAS